MSSCTTVRSCPTPRHHHRRTPQQNLPYRRDPEGREDQHARPHEDVEANYREQSSRWLEETEVSCVRSARDKRLFPAAFSGACGGADAPSNMQWQICRTYVPALTGTRISSHL